MLKVNKQKQSEIRLPKIDSRFLQKSRVQTKTTVQQQVLDQRQNDSMEVSKLQQWSMNKPTKKAKTMINTHNISFLYRSSAVRRQKTKQFGNNYKFMDAQLHLAKVDSQLQKISEINYFSIYKNLQYCSGVYENCFNTLLKTIAKHRTTIQTQVDQIQLKLQIQRQQHLKKVHQLQQNNNQSYKDHMNQVRQLLQDKQNQIKPLKKLLDKIDATKIKVLKYCLSIGYDVRDQGLVWILKQLNTVPKIQEFPSFLSPKQINFIITKFTNQYEVSHVQTLMKTEICGKTINEAYEYVNRRKRRQLSFIKQNQQLVKLYTHRIKDYNRQKHNYLYDNTLLIAQQLQKQKPKPTRYEIIYKQTSKKLNKICRQKIHPQIYGKSNNKQNKKLSKQQKANKQEGASKLFSEKENNKSSKEINQKLYKNSQTNSKLFKDQINTSQKQGDLQMIRRKQKKKSTIIIQEFSKMLNLSIKQSKKLDQLYTKEQKQFQEILRQIRNEKYNETNTHRASFNKFDQNAEDNKLRNPISILGCLVGWKKAQKIIEQEMFGF